MAVSVTLFGLLTGDDFFMLLGVGLGVLVAAVSLVARDAVMKWMIEQAEAAD